MRSLFAYSLFVALVHLVTALLPPITTYAIGSMKTKYWISNYGIASGSDVITSGPYNNAPADAVVRGVQLTDVPSFTKYLAVLGCRSRPES